MRLSKHYLDDLTYEINGAAIEVHRTIGPGLLESVYHKCLEHELGNRGVSYQTELEVPVQCKMIEINTTLKCDLLVENAIVIELKSVNALTPVFDAQLLTYMKLLNVPKGILFNFNTYNLFKDGQKTLVNRLYETLEK
ncbi:MAG: GxxExxY protein [Crocinitomicaceae bacterium]